MVKAGALYYAIFVSFMVALLGGFVIMSVWLHHVHALSVLDSERLERNVNSGILLVEEYPNLVPEESTKEIDLYDDGSDIVTVSKKYWGVYELITAKAQNPKSKKEKMALCGKDVFKNESYALYLADKQQYLSLSGNTLIKGDCYVPKLGLRGAYIEGYSYLRKTLTEGKTFSSKTELPAIYTRLQNSIREYINGHKYLNDSVINANVLLQKDSFAHSFFKKTVVLYSDKWITIANKSIKGNIRIISNKGITLRNTATIQDAVVYAPTICLEKGFSGKLQLLARDTIIVNEGVRLQYPSFLGIFDTDNPAALIKIDKSCDLRSDILLTSRPGSKISQSICGIEAGTVVTGRVYCDAKIELKGSVHGTVFAKGFLLKTTGSVYENHLLNATINFAALPEYYSGSLMNEPIERYKNIKWMH